MSGLELVYLLGGGLSCMYVTWFGGKVGASRGVVRSASIIVSLIWPLFYGLALAVRTYRWLRRG